MQRHGIRSRLKQGRVPHALAAYLVGAWVLLQVVATLKDLIGLPTWIGPASVSVLALGMLIVGATAWVQSNPATDEKERAGEVPGDWEVAPGDLLRSLIAGRLPHLNWARAVAGGFIALTLLSTAAAGYMVTQDRERTRLLAAESGLGVAVLPFDATGAGVEPALGEGLMDLIATNIDAMTGLRAVSPRVVVARFDAHDHDHTALALARELRATYLVAGRVTGVGPRLRVTTELRDGKTGRRVGSPLQADGSPDELLQLADRLSVQVATRILERDPEFAQGFRPSLALTASPAALRAFLDGESQFRALEFDSAHAAYQTAVKEDSTFALAWARVAAVVGWVVPGSPEIDLATQRALRDRSRLPERDRLFIEGMYSAATREQRDLDSLRAAVRRYPDDAMLWYVLGEFYAHHGQHFLASQRDAYDAFLTAVRLEPAFTPHYIHAIELSVILDDTATSRDLMAAAGARLDTDDGRSLLISHNLAFGTGDAWHSARVALDTTSHSGTGIEIPLALPRLLELKDAYTARRRERQPNYRTARIRLTTLALRGRMHAALAQLDDPLLTPRDRMHGALMLSLLGAPAPGRGWDAYLSLHHADTTLTTYVLLGGVAAAERGDAAEHDRARRLMQQLEQARVEVNDTMALKVIRKRRLALEGYGAWRLGTLDDARRLLDAAAPPNEDLLSGLVRWASGEVAFAQRRDDDALRIYESLLMWDSDHNEFPLRRLRIADIHARAGRTAHARAALEELLLVWKDADPSYAPLQQARHRLATLSAQ